MTIPKLNTDPLTNNTEQERSIFHVSLPEWKGPIELLMQLIRTSELNVQDISIANITDDYLSAVSKMEIEHNDASNFLSMASLLVVLKTRSLLPISELEVVDEQLEKELKETKELFDLLIRYEQFRRASVSLADGAKETVTIIDYEEDEEDNRKDFFISYKENQINLAENTQNISVAKLFSSVELLLKDRVLDFEIRSRFKKRKSFEIAIKIEKLRQFLQEKEESSLFELVEHISEDIHDRFSLLGYFFSILELYKQDELKVWQKEDFEDIFIKLESIPR